MANPADISHSFILMIFSLSLYFFYTYKTAHLDTSITYVEREDENYSTANSKPLSVTKVSLAKNKTIPNSRSSIGENLTNGILTSHLYEASYNIPNVNLCPNLGASLKFLILVTSAPSHAVARMAIRLTWGHTQRKDIAMSFVLGQAKTPKLTSAIRTESDLYSDIIGCRFEDSYDNLTLKTICMMEWIDNHCLKVKFTLKTDADMFINIPKLISFVDQQCEYNRTIFGSLLVNCRPHRNRSNKWFVSTQHYPLNIYPDFILGPAHLLTGDIVYDLYVTALNTTFLKLEDVFITGVIAKAIKVKITTAKEFAHSRVAFTKHELEKYVSIHRIKSYEQFNYGKLFMMIV